MDVLHIAPGVDAHLVNQDIYLLQTVDVKLKTVKNLKMESVSLVMNNTDPKMEDVSDLLLKNVKDVPQDSLLELMVVALEGLPDVNNMIQTEDVIDAMYHLN